MLKKLCLLFFFLSFPMLINAEDWLIIAHGPSFSSENVHKNSAGRKIIALDGAADDLKAHQMHPHIILGDFDSILDKEYWGITHSFNFINETSTPYQGHFGIFIVPAKNQDYTDLEKAIIFCDKQKANSIRILNATGGRIDHSLRNIGLLRKHYNPDRQMMLLTETECIQFVKNKNFMLKGKPGDPCAFLGYPEATMTTTGLAYNGSDYSLKLGMQESVCNALAEAKAEIFIKGEAIVISQKNSFVPLPE